MWLRTRKSDANALDAYLRSIPLKQLEKLRIDCAREHEYITVFSSFNFERLFDVRSYPQDGFCFCERMGTNGNVK